MTAYSTISQVRAATGLTNSTKISDARVTQAIATADGLIDSYIGDAYSLPLSSVPDLIEQASVEIAAAYLYMDEYGEETENLDKGWEKKLNWWIKNILEVIRDRKMKLYAAGVELDTSSLLQAAFYPNNASEVDPNNPTPARFSMNKKY